MVTNVHKIPLEVAGDLFASYRDSGGRYRTLSLFKEHELDSYPAYFTLKKHDKGKYISMYRKYLEIADPTEYQVAIRLLGSWDHWQQLLKSKWFNEYVQSWREELKVKMASERYFEMLENVKDSKTTVAATKWLEARYGQAKNTPKRGRPSNDEVANNLKEQAELDKELIEDLARIQT